MNTKRNRTEQSSRARRLHSLNCRATMSVKKFDMFRPIDTTDTDDGCGEQTGRQSCRRIYSVCKP